MYLGYQNEKIKFYTEEPLDSAIYPVDEWVETQNEYVLEEDCYVLKNEEWEEKQAIKERERINQLSLTKREVFLALYKDKGITPEQIKAQITNPEALIEFEYASDYFRGNPLIDLIGQTFGYSSEDLDYLFEHRKLRQTDDTENTSAS